MRKSLFMLMALISIFSMLCASAYTPPPPEPKYLQLYRFRFKKHKGYVFVYNMSGEYTKDELVGWVYVEDQKMRLECWINEVDSRVSCSAQKLKGFVGKTATVVLAGTENIVIIPEPVERWYCYSIYDLSKNLDGWEHIGDKCLADEEAEYGMSLEQYSEIWEGTYTYHYLDSTPCNEDDHKGFYFSWEIADNYYWIPCP